MNTQEDSKRDSVDVRRLVMRKSILLLSIAWMIPWWILAQFLRVAICLVVGMQNLWWQPIYEAKDSWDSNA